MRKISSISSRERRRVSIGVVCQYRNHTERSKEPLTRVEEVDAGDDEGVDDSEDNVGLVSDGLESDRGNHDDHAGVELAQMYDKMIEVKLTS